MLVLIMKNKTKMSVTRIVISMRINIDVIDQDSDVDEDNIDVNDEDSDIDEDIIDVIDEDSYVDDEDSDVIMKDSDVDEEYSKDINDKDSDIDAPPRWWGELAEAVEDVDEDTEVVVPG